MIVADGLANVLHGGVAASQATSNGRVLTATRLNVRSDHEVCSEPLREASTGENGKQRLNKEELVFEYVKLAQRSYK